MIHIPEYPSDDTLLRLFSARTPRPFTELFYCYHALVCRETVEVLFDSPYALKVIVTSECGIKRVDNRYIDYSGERKWMRWSGNHNMVLLERDVVGISQSAHPALLRINTRTMEWMTPIDMRHGMYMMRGAAQWLDKDPDNIYIFGTSAQWYPRFIKMNRFRPIECDEANINYSVHSIAKHFVALDFQKIMLYADDATDGIASGWIYDYSLGVRVGIRTTCHVETMKVAHLSGDLVTISGMFNQLGARKSIKIVHNTRTLTDQYFQINTL